MCAIQEETKTDTLLKSILQICALFCVRSRFFRICSCGNTSISILFSTQPYSCKHTPFSWFRKTSPFFLNIETSEVSKKSIWNKTLSKEGRWRSTVNPRKTEMLKMRFVMFSSHFNAKFSILALQNVPTGAFCNDIMLHWAVVCL